MSDIYSKTRQQNQSSINIPESWKHDGHFNREAVSIPSKPSHRSRKRHHGHGMLGGGGDYRTSLQRRSGRGRSQP